jgi:hypothetical protein
VNTDSDSCPSGTEGLSVVLVEDLSSKIYSKLCNKVYICSADFITYQETVQPEVSSVGLVLEYSAEIWVTMFRSTLQRSFCPVTSNCPLRDLCCPAILRWVYWCPLPTFLDKLFVPSSRVKIPDPWRLDQYIVQMQSGILKRTMKQRTNATTNSCYQ